MKTVEYNKAWTINTEKKLQKFIQKQVERLFPTEYEQNNLSWYNDEYEGAGSYVCKGVDLDEDGFKLYINLRAGTCTIERGGK